MIKPVLHYFNLADEVVCFSTTRHGGVSKGKLATLNINPHRGDEPSAVAENLQAVAAEIGVKADKIVRLHQIHETHCLTVTDDFFHLSAVNSMRGKKGKMLSLPIVVTFALVFIRPIVFLFFFTTPFTLLLGQPMPVGVVRCNVSLNIHFVR